MAASTQSIEQKLIDLCGDKFVQTFYTIIDSRRNDIIQLFTQSSTCIYDGNPAIGKQTITQLYSVLPPSKHSIDTIDIQPIDKSIVNNTQQQNKQTLFNIDTLLISVTGTVQYGTDSRINLYHHTFIIDKCDPQKPNIHYIVYATFRSRVGDTSKTNRQDSVNKRIRA